MGLRLLIAITRAIKNQNSAEQSDQTRTLMTESPYGDVGSL